LHGFLPFDQSGSPHAARTATEAGANGLIRTRSSTYAAFDKAAAQHAFTFTNSFCR
jgi:hypothetical protein